MPISREEQEAAFRSFRDRLIGVGTLTPPPYQMRDLHDHEDTWRFRTDLGQGDVLWMRTWQHGATIGLSLGVYHGEEGEPTFQAMLNGSSVRVGAPENIDAASVLIEDGPVLEFMLDLRAAAVKARNSAFEVPNPDSATASRRHQPGPHAPEDHPFRDPVREAGLVLRLPTWTDVPALTEMWDDPSLAFMFPDAYDGSWPDHGLLLEMASGAVTRENVLVVENEQGVPVGTLHLNGFHRQEPALGWYVAPDHRRQGIATRAVEAAMRHLFVGHCETLAAYMDPRNDASRGLLEKLGFGPGPCPRPNLAGFVTTRAIQAERLAAGASTMRPAA